MINAASSAAIHHELVRFGAAVDGAPLLIVSLGPVAISLTDRGTGRLALSVQTNKNLAARAAWGRNRADRITICICAGLGARGALAGDLALIVLNLGGARGADDLCLRDLRSH